MASPRKRPARTERPLRPIPPVVLRAARRVFLRYGVHKTTMSDIADEAGIPRPTLYEFVSSRNDLIDAVVVHRITEISDRLVRVATAAASFADAVVDTSVQAVELTRTDRELTNIFATAPHLHVHQILEGDHPAVVDVVTRFLQPLVEHGRAERLLRGDVTEALLVDWFRVVYSGFIYREQVDPDDVRTLMRTFLLPSLTCGAPTGKPAGSDPGVSATSY